jgi:hypothetical protein
MPQYILDLKKLLLYIDKIIYPCYATKYWLVNFFTFHLSLEDLFLQAVALR